MNAQLRKPYVSVLTPHGPSYGGSQMWSSDPLMKKCGCGIVAAKDVLMYLCSSPEKTVGEYCKDLDQLRHRYFPLLYPNGINGILLVSGMNKLFRHLRLPYHASWAIAGDKLISRIQSMLTEDCPVILAIGPNFPFLWNKNTLTLYHKTPDGHYSESTRVCGHYVVVTGIDEDWLRISSWGRRYFISIQEYGQYVRNNSIYLFSNIVKIQRK